MTLVEDISVVEGLLVSLMHEASNAAIAAHRWLKDDNVKLLDECRERGIVYTNAANLLNMLLHDAKQHNSIKTLDVFLQLEGELTDTLDHLNDQVRRLALVGFDTTADTLTIRAEALNYLVIILHSIRTVELPKEITL